MSKRIRQDDILTQPKNAETNDSESLRNSANIEQDTSYPEDLTLTHFVNYLEKTFQFLGGFDWEPRAEHRQIVNSLAFEGHLVEWSSVKFGKMGQVALLRPVRRQMVSQRKENVARGQDGLDRPAERHRAANPR